jgi:sarcosine oxidase subunit beta
MHISIIGGGIIGCSIALALARREMTVTVIDRLGAVGHGSTSASSAIVRRYYSQPGMIAMAHEAAHIWANWSDFLGPIEDDLIRFHRPGMLFIPPHIDADVRATVREMQKLGISAQLMSANELEQRFPFLNIASQYPPRTVADKDFFQSTDKKIEAAIFEEDAGYIVSPGLAAQNLRSAAAREGVGFMLHTNVFEIEQTSSGGFRLLAEAGVEIESDALVNAAGPHSSNINQLARINLPLTTRPMRQEVHALENPRFVAGNGSDVPIVADMESGVYWRPDRSDQDIIVGSTEPECDELEWLDHPDIYDTNITDLWWQRQSLRVMKRFPAVQQSPARGIAALYDVSTADWYPIVDKTDLNGYFVCIGTSGSSFKTAPVLGQLTAKIIEDWANGIDTDSTPSKFELKHTGNQIETNFLSRNRSPLASAGNVIA